MLPASRGSFSQTSTTTRRDYEASELFIRLLQDTNTTNSTGTTLSDGQILRTTFTIYGSILLVAFISFCFVRLRFPRPYTIRKWVEDVKTKIAENQFGFVSWMWNINLFTDDEILDECGMDSLCFLRLLKMGYRISCVCAFNALWLMPVYKFADSSSETQGITDPIVQVSITNVPSGSPRLVATVLAAYVLFGYIMYLIHEEFKWFTEWRHKYLRKPKPRNYSIFVRNIPLEYRTERGLETFFQRCFASENILDAQLSVNAPKLRKAVKARDRTIAQLENDIVYEEIYGQEVYIRKNLVGSAKIRSIQYYCNELNAVNDMISNRIMDIEARTTYTSMSSGSSGSVNPLQGLRDVTSGLIPLQSFREGEYYPCGFVSFTNLCTTNAALQMIHHETPFEIEVLNAPDPEDIFWDNIGLSHKEIQVGSLISSAGSVALCFLWTIPMAFISTASSVEALKSYDFIADLIEAAPILEPILQQMAPLFLLWVNSMLPAILKFLSMREGPVSSSVVEASLFTKLAAFTIIQTFFVSFIGGSLIPQLKKMVEDPWGIIDLLAEVLPQKSTYFIQIVFVSNAISMTLEILRIIPLLMALIRGCLSPKLTEKQRQTTVHGIAPLAQPKEFDQAANLATVVLNFMVLLVYAVIAPITAFIIGFGFLFMHVCFLHQLIYIYPTMPDSGGKIWANFIKVLMSCMTISQVTIIGLMSLKKAAIATPLMIPLIIITVLFNGYIRQQHFRVGEFLPSRQCLKIDLQNGPNFDLSFLKDAYRQEELKTKRKYPELTEMQLARLERLGVTFVRE